MRSSGLLVEAVACVRAICGCQCYKKKLVVFYPTREAGGRGAVRRAVSTLVAKCGVNLKKSAIVARHPRFSVRKSGGGPSRGYDIVCATAAEPCVCVCVFRSFEFRPKSCSPSLLYRERGGS